jgi:hypothetical protein
MRYCYATPRRDIATRTTLTSARRAQACVRPLRRPEHPLRSGPSRRHRRMRRHPIGGSLRGRGQFHACCQPGPLIVSTLKVRAVRAAGRTRGRVGPAQGLAHPPAQGATHRASLVATTSTHHGQPAYREPSESAGWSGRAVIAEACCSVRSGRRGRQPRAALLILVRVCAGGLLGAGGGHASDSALRAAAAGASGTGSGAWSWRG